MIKSNKNVLFAAALLCAALGFSSCSSAPTTKTNGNTAVVTSNTNTTTTTTNVTKTETAATGDKTGVTECDEYIEKYEVCLTKIAAKAPQAEAGLKTAFEQQRKAFKDAAANPQAKAGLSAGCKQAIDTAKQSTSTYGCAW